MKKVLFISNIGFKKKSIPNGVNVKNRHILRYLSGIKGVEVKTIDTDNWKLRIVQLFFQIFIASIVNQKIILSINTKSAYQIIKFLYLLGLDKKLIYFVVGGSLHEQVSKGILKLKYFTNISKIFVQTERMERELNAMGLINVQELPNSKYFEDLNLNYKRNIKSPIKCFYLGRIHPDKGIDLIFESFQEINSNLLKYEIDFYGPVEKIYEKDFMKKIDKYDFAEFKGTIDLIDNIENYYKLSDYDLFIFPTYWHGEGFPGVVIDSFISGVPVLSSDWNHNEEVIKDGYNGIIFETKNICNLVDKLNYIEQNKDLLIKMRENAHKSSFNYKTEKVLRVLDNII